MVGEIWPWSFLKAIYGYLPLCPEQGLGFR
jgi:hypothetical protein